MVSMRGPGPLGGLNNLPMGLYNDKNIEYKTKLEIKTYLLRQIYLQEYLEEQWINLNV